MSKIVVPSILGYPGLGNQLFLIAACYAHCLKNGYKMFLKNESRPLLEQILNNKFEKIDDCSSLSQYKEPTYRYTPIPNEITGLISGYFQSSKHFKHYEKEIKEMFRKLKADYKSEGVAAIHVRMGDYLRLSYRWKSPSKDFIERAIKQLSPHIKRLVVFSDNPKEACDLVCSCERPKDMWVVAGTMDYSDEINDIREMTACEEFIMSCSSFSWWTAYLGEHKKVIVDKKWYNDGLIDKDIYEDTWIKI